MKITLTHALAVKNISKEKHLAIKKMSVKKDLIAVVKKKNASLEKNRVVIDSKIAKTKKLLGKRKSSRLRTQRGDKNPASFAILVKRKKDKQRNSARWSALRTNAQSLLLVRNLVRWIRTFYQ
ncbi:hypothetical protein D3C87_1610710 [compost metagenome]